jgi:hypothetical protein
VIPDHVDDARRRLASIRAKGGIRCDGAAEAALARAKDRTPPAYSSSRWADKIDAERVRLLKWRAAGEPRWRRP